jgi:hypothetical protein
MKKILLLAFPLLVTLVSTSKATVGIGLTGGYFYDQSGSLLNSGTLALVASTTDSSFNQLISGGTLSENSFLATDELVLKTFSIGNDGTSTNAFNIDQSSYTNLGAGDGLAIYWFPSLTAGSTITDGTKYGFFTSASGTPDSDAWTMASDGSSITLQFVTDAAGGSSSIPEISGYANLTAVPEPATTVALLGGAAGLFVLYRRRRQKSDPAAPAAVA